MPNIHIEQLKRLPQRPDEVWQGGLVRMPSWVVGEGARPYRPRAAIWIAVKDDKVGPTDMCPPDEANFAMALASLVKFATDEKVGGYRPGRIEVRDAALAEYLAGSLAETGIEVVATDGLATTKSVVS